MTVDQTSKTAGPDDRNEDAAALTATVLTAVERQLTRYFSAMTHRVDDSIAATERLRTEVKDQLTTHSAAADGQRAANEAYQQALQRAIDERLGEIAAHHASRLAEFDSRLTVLAAQPAGVSPEDLLQIRQSMREDIWRSLGPVTERLDALTDVTRRSDEQQAALVEHVNATTTTLITRIDDGDQLVTLAVDERVGEVRTELTSRLDDLDTNGTTRANAIDARIGDVESAVTARIGEVESTAAARDEAISNDVTALGDLISEATTKASERMGELDKRLGSINLDLATLSTKVAGIDSDAIDDLKSQMSAAIGESMLVRIELDRVVATNEEKLDKTNVRLGEIEALLTDEMDVGAAVQLERLDELERAIMFLDPDQFVRKDEVLTDSSDSPINSASNGADTSVHGQALHGEESFADDSGDSTYDDAHSPDALSGSEAWS